jgi:hypothetical protein
LKGVAVYIQNLVQEGYERFKSNVRSIQLFK